MCLRVREPHALFAEVEVRSEGRGDPPHDPNHTQAMHYRRNLGREGGREEGGGRDHRMKMQYNGTRQGRTNGVGEGAKGNSLGLFFLQIVLLQTLAG